MSDTVTTVDSTEKPEIVRKVVKAPRVAALVEQLQAEKAELEAQLAPYREFYEAHVNDPKYLEAKVKIKELNAKIAPLCNELAAIARANGAKSIKIEPGNFAKTDG
jgi:hypothetical protein